MDNKHNNYLKILLHLKQFEGDGRLHDVENIIDLDHSATLSVIEELAKSEYIILSGGYYMGGIMIGDGPYHGGGYIKAEARLTIKGAQYLKEELKMIESNKYNIHIGNNSTANLIMDSAGSTIHNNIKYNEAINKILDTLQNDSTLESSIKDEALSTFKILKTELERGNSDKSIWNDALTIGSNIASIGSLVLALFQQYVK